MARRIGVLGSGDVAKTLAQGALQHGYETSIGNRTVEKIKSWAESIPGLNYGTYNEVAAVSDIVILGVKGAIADSVVSGLKNELAGKVVIDACNSVSGAPVDGILPYRKYPGDVSLMEHLQSIVPDAHFVKAFNSVGSSLMVNPQLHGGPPTMFICGNNKNAKGEVKELLTRFGWETADLGPARAAGAIEQLCVIWCSRGFNEGKWSHAFKLLTKD